MKVINFAEHQTVVNRYMSEPGTCAYRKTGHGSAATWKESGSHGV